MEIVVKVRSTRPPSPASLHVNADGGVAVTLAAGEEGVAPGQACVFYSMDEESRVLGGGWIAATRSEVAAA